MKTDSYADKLTPERLEKIERTVNHRTRHFAMVLEDLKDPHNISAVVRTSEVFGFQDVYVIEEINYYNPSKAILRGSLKWLDLHRFKKRMECLQTLRQKGYQIAVASTNTTTSLTDIDCNKPTAFYLGSESLGNHPETLKQADVHFYIPQYGLTESMNVSVCAGVLMSTLRSWMETQGFGKFRLPSEEREVLKEEFSRRSVMKKTGSLVEPKAAE